MCGIFVFVSKAKIILFKMSTNAQWTWADAMEMQIVQILMDPIIALAITAIKEMDSIALVIRKQFLMPVYQLI